MNPKQQVLALLRSIETGDAAAVAAIDPDKYIQHNLAAADGLAGFGALMQLLPPGSAKVNTVRAFQDGDFVFTHTDYDFFGPKVGFDIFRFEEGRIVEHWDNLQEKTPAGPRLDGPTEARDLHKTDGNKMLVRALVEARKDRRVHQVLGEGDFVLVVSESNGGKPLAAYELFRVQDGRIAEQWSTVEAIPPRAEWKNGNGKF